MTYLSSNEVSSENHYFCSMSFITGLLIASDASSLGRLEYTMLSQQAQMEIFVCGLDEAFRKSLQDPNGAFLDVCDWPAVRCDTDENVQSLSSWDAWGGIANFDFLPPKLERLNFYGHRRDVKGTITGTMNIGLLPRTMVCLTVDHNLLSGPLGIPELPPGMTNFIIDGNLFFGECDISHLPPAMEEFEASQNKFCGSICLDSLPETLVSLILSENFFSGDLNLKSLPKYLERLDMAKNELRGDFVLTLAEGSRLWMADFRENSFEGTAVVSCGPNSRLMLRLNGNAVEDVVDGIGAEHPMKNKILHAGYPSWP